MISAAEARARLTRPSKMFDRIYRLIETASLHSNHVWAHIDPRDATVIEEHYRALGFTVRTEGENALISW